MVKFTELCLAQAEGLQYAPLLHVVLLDLLDTNHAINRF
jgi:hypothetical protein